MSTPQAPALRGAAVPIVEGGKLSSVRRFFVRTRAWWIALLLAVVAAAGIVRWSRKASIQAPTYKTMRVEPRTIVGRVTASGTLGAVVTVQVGSQVSGRVQHLYADFNSQVKKGELVAKIDPQLFEAAVAQASANTESAKAALEQAQAQALDADRRLARARELFAQGLMGKQDLEAAETSDAVTHAQIGVAQSSLKQARAALHQSQVNLSYTNILSPIDGVVISRNVDVGQTVAATLQAPVIFTIAEDLKKMQVDTDVAEGDVGRLAVGMPSSFTVDAFPGVTFNGKIREIRNAAKTLQNVVTYDAVVDVANDDLRLRPGMTANVVFVFDTREHALAAPNSALRFKMPNVDDAPSKDVTSSNHTLWVLRDGKATSLVVRTGLSDGTWTEIVSGDLREGDEVIVDATGVTAENAPTRKLF